MPDSVSDSSPRQGFAAFKALVIASPALFQELAAEEHPMRFQDRVIELARLHGCAVSREELEAETRLARRRWIERRVL
ncbi:MAG: hypothetical protein JSS11_04350 [Verrucomicrobia bacterium]|nr:hypothetical protein [Verrucomicrobiota bacterium]